MKIFNFLLGYSPGGIAQCYLIYNKLGDVDSSVAVKSVCVCRNEDASLLLPLQENGITVINADKLVDFKWIKQVAAIIREEKPDILFCHGFNGPVVIQLIKWLYRLKTPMVCTYHGLYHPPTKSRKWLAPLFNGVQILLYRFFAKRVITVENFSKKYLIEKGIASQKITVVHNGIQEKAKQTQPIMKEDDKIVIGMACRIDAIKGIDYLLDAVLIIKNSSKTQFKVSIVGSGPEFETLKNKAKELQIDGIVAFEGYHNNVPDWLNYFDIFVVASKSECHSISILEAMRSGKAIVATNVGGNPESIRDGVDGLLVPAKDAKALAETIAKLMEDQPQREELGKNAKNRFFEEFTETRMKQNLINAIKE